MRMLSLLVVLPLCAAPALAQTAVPSPATATAAVQPAQATPAEPAPKPPASHRRGGWEQHFSDANTTHDGHLTLDQAKTHYVTIARHFSAIDAGHKGYVTLDDVRAWHKAQREARHRSATRSDRLQPRPAMHHTMIDRPEVPTGSPPALPKGIDPRAPS